MDVKVYEKEAVRQPSGTEYVITPNIIDIIPDIVLDENEQEVVTGAVELSKEQELVEQACALATIFQKGLDPLALEDGIRWSETLLGEINVVQLMEDITSAVAQITPTVEVVFTTVTDENGNSFLKYTLQAVA